MSLLTYSDLKVYDVFIFVETWETHPVEVPLFHVAHSLAKKREGPGRPSSGVTVIYNHRLENAACVYAEDDTVVVEARNCVIIAIYASPSEPLDCFEDRLINASCWIRTEKPTVLCGDLNAPLNRTNEKRTKFLGSFLEYSLGIL